MILLALVIFLHLFNTGILRMMRLKTFSFAKAMTPLSVGFHIFSWILKVLRGTLAL